MAQRATAEAMKAWIREMLEEETDRLLLHRIYNLLVQAYMKRG